MSRCGTVLLVEDNDDDVQLTLRAFERSKAFKKIVVVRNGREAVEYLFTTGAHAGRDPEDLPEVVLLDLHLPSLDGFDVLRRLRADVRTRRLPVVILTSSNEQADILRSYDLGANSFVRKPVDFAKFVDVARQLGRYWLVMNEQPASERRGDGSSAALPQPTGGVTE